MTGPEPAESSARRSLWAILLGVVLLVSAFLTSIAAKALTIAAGKPHLYNGPGMVVEVVVSWMMAVALAAVAISHVGRSRPPKPGVLAASIAAAVLGPIVAGALYLSNCLLKC